MDSIIFDVDGTLWDSTEVVAKAWNNYLQKEEHMNITFTADQLKALFGKPLAEIAALIFPEHPVDEQSRLIDGCCEAEHALLHITGAPLYEDLEKALQILSAKYPLYIVSNSQCGYIELFLEKTVSANISGDISAMEIPDSIKVPISVRLLTRMV